jgi:hypothetical protein
LVALKLFAFLYTRAREYLLQLFKQFVASKFYDFDLLQKINLVACVFK